MTVLWDFMGVQRHWHIQGEYLTSYEYKFDERTITFGLKCQGLALASDNVRNTQLPT